MRILTVQGTLLACLVALLISMPSAAKKRKCRATLNSDAYYNSWEKANVKWKSPKHQVDGVVEATVHGRIDIPTNVGSTVKGHVCYATLQVNLSDCSIVLGANATNATSEWSPHKSAVYTSPDTWLWNDTIAFRPDCPEKIHVEVFEA